MEQILDDMEHRVRKVIADHREDPGFPKIEDYGVSEEDFDDYMTLSARNTPSIPSSSSYPLSSWLFLTPQ